MPTLDHHPSLDLLTSSQGLHRHGTLPVACLSRVDNLPLYPEFVLSELPFWENTKKNIVGSPYLTKNCVCSLITA